MAEVSAFRTMLMDLERIPKGKDIRKPVIGILDNIDKNGIDAATFNGLSQREYVKEDGSEQSLLYRINKIKSAYAKDETPSTSSERLLMTKGIRSIIGKLSSYPEIESGGS